LINLVAGKGNHPPEGLLTGGMNTNADGNKPDMGTVPIIAGGTVAVQQNRKLAVHMV
jgi:hypothetical protein